MEKDKDYIDVDIVLRWIEAVETSTGDIRLIIPFALEKLKTILDLGSISYQLEMINKKQPSQVAPPPQVAPPQRMPFGNLPIIMVIAGAIMLSIGVGLIAAAIKHGGL